MLEAESIQAALLGAAGEVQAVMNHLGLSARSAPSGKLAFDDDMRASLRKALQFGRSELVNVQWSMGTGALREPTDVVVSAKTKVPQFAVELQWHPRGEDHAGFATAAVADIVKMALARTRGVVEQSCVLVAAPARFWRWLPGFAEERRGYELLSPERDTPVSARSDFLAGSTWDFVFDAGMDRQLPDRLWSSVMGDAEIRSPWAELDLRLLEVKGLGAVKPVRD